MAYVDPATVSSPMARIRSVQVIYNDLARQWSVARISWVGEDEGIQERIGVRWNGGEGPGVGNPQSRGKATWFIVPEPLQKVILEKVEEISLGEPGGLLERYSEMARDQERERDAEEWSEGLIGDASAQR